MRRTAAFAFAPLAAAAISDLLISEFRLRGPGGAEDEFVELYNNADSPYVVDSADESFGYAVAASDGVARCVIPNETVIPARGHYLCINSVGYSLGVAAGAGNTALGDATYTTDIPAYLLKFMAGADAYNDAVRLQIR